MLKIGDRVRFRDLFRSHESEPEYYPLKGTIGTVMECRTENPTERILVKWPEGSLTSENDTIWFCYQADVEKVNDEDSRTD